MSSNPVAKVERTLEVVAAVTTVAVAMAVVATAAVEVTRWQQPWRQW